MTSDITAGSCQAEHLVEARTPRGSSCQDFWNYLAGLSSRAFFHPCRFTQIIPSYDLSLLSVFPLDTPELLSKRSNRIIIQVRLLFTFSASLTHLVMMKNQLAPVLERLVLCYMRTSFANTCCLVMIYTDRKSTRLNSSHSGESRMPSSA